MVTIPNDNLHYISNVEPDFHRPRVYYKNSVTLWGTMEEWRARLTEEDRKWLGKYLVEFSLPWTYSKKNKPYKVVELGTRETNNELNKGE